MSEYRVTTGLMARLVEAVPEDDYESVSDRLFEADSCLHINYDGSLIFSTDVDVPAYEFDISIGTKLSKTAFIEKCLREGFCVDENSIEPYVSVWCDNADSPMSTTTIGDFLNANQKD